MASDSKLGRIFLGVGLLVTAGISLLYFNQAKLLYVPDYPIKYARDNPLGYRSPLDRQMKYQEITLKVDGPSGGQIPEEPVDGGQPMRQPVTYIPGVDTCIRGWYIYKDPNEA